MQKTTRVLRPIFLMSFLFFAHLSLVMYINSSVLGLFVSSSTISTLYVLGAAGSLALLFCMPHIVERIGLVTTTVSIFVLLAMTLLLLGTTMTPELVIIVFVIYSALTATVWYCNDMFVAHYAKTEVMGHTRGMYLTINNTAVALMPVLAGILIVHFGFHAVYILASVLLLVAACIINISQRYFVDRKYTSADIGVGWDIVRHSPSLRRVVIINFLLQFFYAVMVIYSPLYLLRVAHFSWSTIGLLFSIMLLAFVILQYPIGILSDKIGQKKLLIIGLIIAGLSTIVFGMLGAASVAIFIVILFCTRIGASMMEVLSESYFFKQINDKDESVISIYRMMYPIAYILAPLTGWLVLTHTSYRTLFILLGLLLLAGALYCIRLIDIRTIIE